MVKEGGPARRRGLPPMRLGDESVPTSVDLTDRPAGPGFPFG